MLCHYQYCVGRYGSNSENEVSQQEVMEAETNWNIPIIKVRHAGANQGGQGAAPANLPEVASALNTICEQLWLAAHRDRMAADCWGYKNLIIDVVIAQVLHNLYSIIMCLRKFKAFYKLFLHKIYIF